MATYNLGNTGVVPKGGFQWSGTPKITVVEHVLDLSKRTGLNVPAAGYVVGDVLKLFDIPKGAYVLDGSWELLVAEGAALTFTGATVGTAFTFQTAGASLNGTLNVVNPNDVLVGRALVDSYFKITLGGTMGAAGGLAKVAFHFLICNQATNA